MDSNYFVENYNTPLSLDDQEKFILWALKNKRLGDLQDYDMQGFWKNNNSFSANGHGSDFYKKPNHPTFSVESQYNNYATPEYPQGFQGGVWDVQNKTFAPGLNSLWNRERLKRYFNAREPGYTLK